MSSFLKKEALCVCKNKLSVNSASKLPKEYALDFFDVFYESYLTKKWPLTRCALLCHKKSAAVINLFSDPTKAISRITSLGATDLIKDASEALLKDMVKKHLNNQKVSSKMAALGDENADICISHNVDNLSEAVSENFTDAKYRNLSNGALETDNDTASHDELDISSGNIWRPDDLTDNANLQIFIPTEKVFSEKELLRREEVMQNTFEDRPVTVSMLPSEVPMLPKCLHVMAFLRGDVSSFPHPRSYEANMMNYYCMDAASVLPIIALDLKEEENVLDLCAAPGGKSMVILQQLIALRGHLTANDISGSRMTRMATMLKSYFLKDLLEESVTLVRGSGLAFNQPTFDKVLVDVPCNNDRHVLTKNENNLFKPERLKERVSLSALQKNLLIAGIRSCKPGGTVIYSTCTIAPAHNDGVVQAAVEELWETSDIELAAVDLTLLRNAFSSAMEFYPNTRLGQLVIPSLSANYGPAYFCKLIRLK